MGDHRLSLEYLERALAIKEAVYGHDHVFVSSALVCIEDTHRELHDAAKARELIGRALLIDQAAYMYGPDHMKVPTLALLGDAVFALGEVEEATVLLEQSHAIFVRSGHRAHASAVRKMVHDHAATVARRDPDSDSD